MISQATLPTYQSKTQSQKHVPEPEHLLKWYKIRPELRRFILLHVIRVFEGNKTPTIDELVEELSWNMGNIVKERVRIYVENLLYDGLLEYSSHHKINFTENVWKDLETANKILMELKKE